MTTTNEPTASEQADGQLLVGRRAVLQGTATIAGVGAVGALLAACGDGDNGNASTATQDPEQELPQEQAPGATTSAGIVIAAAEVPVGGGTVTIVDDRKVVVTQPTSGEFFGFSAVCPHQGCAVNNVADGRINCPCHNSAFDASTGAVLQGPATAPLAVIAVREEGDDIVFA